MRHNGLGAAAEFPAVIRPDALTPIAIATGLRAEQVEQRVAITRVVGRNAALSTFSLNSELTFSIGPRTFS